jgi:hypothetical protein
MQSGSYVVHLVGRDDPKPYKHYSVRTDAVRNGQDEVQSGSAERTDIYAVDDTNDALAAIPPDHPYH